MAQKRSLSSLVVTFFAIVAVLVAAVCVVLLLEVVRFRNDTESSRRATDLLTASYGAEVSVLDIETGLRGYLLTHQARFLQPYRSAVSAIGPELHSLSGLASGSAQKQRVTALGGAIAHYIDRFAAPLIASRGRLSDPQIAAATLRGKQLVDGLRRRFAAIDAAQLAARARRRRTLNSHTSLTIAIAAAGLGVSLLLLIALGVYTVRGVLRPIRTVAAALDRRGHGDLTARVPEVGRGEVALLERSFNEMAQVLEQRTNELSEANRQLAHAVTVAEEASRMKSEFLANMSHEIRTPLNGVLGMVTLLAGTPLSEEQREYLDMARGSSQTLLNVVSDILDVSKIEAGRLQLEQQDFDLHDLIRATRDMLSQQASAKGLRLTAEMADDVPKLVRGDRLRVGQVLGNLLSNAVKFTAEGEVTLNVSAVERTTFATLVRFEVRDTGIGIPVDRLAALFDPFTQADESTTRQFGGTGLGLTISRDLAQLMGGTITARSEVGAGSSFELTIPFPPPLGEAPALVPSVELRGLRILVVDDNAANRKILEAYVASWGMRSTAARDGDDALAQLASAADEGEPFDIALLDVNMPGESGIELARRITASPRLRGTRLILLSSGSPTLAGLKQDAVQLQLTKPISQSSLLDAIAVAMHTELETGAVTDLVPGRVSVPPAEPRPAVTTPTAPARILVAEDNYVNRVFIERLLTRLGHTVTTAADGRQALRSYESGSFDAIIMDCQMPEFDGYDTTRVIRRREAALGRRRTPILAMTAAATDEIRQRCLDVGMDDYLTKPVNGAEVEQALAAWLPATTVAAAALDPERVDDLRSVFPGAEMATILIRIANEVTNELARLDQSVADGDREGAASAAHSIRGSAQMVGATEVTEATIAVEQAVVKEPLSGEQVSAAMARLRVVWRDARRALEAQVEADRREYHPSETTD
jgi:signal transduction histidine kinase/DNA-binding response OmpR family regulator/HPt (histidine-containing phosphotransfer) domain-containing protein